MQQISSQIPIKFLDLKEWNTVLDTTAAPWSKTSQISAVLNNSGEVIALDNNAIRIDKLNYTLKRQGCKNVVVMKTDARKIAEPLWEYLVQEGWKTEDMIWYFDNILFDAPCSAEGRFNLNSEKSYAFWNTSIPKKNL